MILKAADPAYEFILPYKLVMADVPTYNVDGELNKDKDGNTITRKERQKVLLDVTFNADGSLDTITEKVS